MYCYTLLHQWNTRLWRDITQVNVTFQHYSIIPMIGKNKKIRQEIRCIGAECTTSSIVVDLPVNRCTWPSTSIWMRGSTYTELQVKLMWTSSVNCNQIAILYICKYWYGYFSYTDDSLKKNLRLILYETKKNYMIWIGLDKYRYDIKE